VYELNFYILFRINSVYNTHLLVRKDITYIRTLTARVQLKKSLAVSLKGLGAKTD
jgi:hypothetical protein